jgi:hypothetical protein
VGYQPNHTTPQPGGLLDYSSSDPYPLEADNEKIPTSVFSSFPSIGIDPVEPYKLKETLQICRSRKHQGVNKNTKK